MKCMARMAIPFLLAALGSSASFSRAAAGPFRAGAAAVDVTPRNAAPEPPSIIAGGFLESRSDRVHDPLFVRAIVLDDGGPGGREPVRIALVVVDSCMMPQPLLDEAKALAAKRCGIPAERMMVSATHTHAAPAAMGCLGTRQDTAYAARLPAAIAEAIVAASTKLEPAAIGWAAVDDWAHTHNRRWIRRPETRIVDPFGNPTGLAHMHPGYQSKDVIGPSGPVDPQLSVVSIRTAAGRPLAVLANYSQHYFGTPAVSADYFGHFCRSVATALGEQGEGNGPFVCCLSQGTSGDLMWMDYGSPKRSISIRDYAAAVAETAVEALRRVDHRDDVPLAMTQKVLPLAYRVPDAARLAWARPIAAAIPDDLPRNIPEVYAREAIILDERQRTTLTLQAIRIGDLTIATLPNEVYALTGLKLRSRSPADMHFNVSCANGAEGYIPPPEQHVLGGYTTWPARTAGLEVGAEPRIVETLVAALEEVTGEPRRTAEDEHGPAARAVLEAKPTGYWRLEDDDGAAPRNTVAGAAAARLTPGFAWYLPGVGAGSGIGPGESLTAGAFAAPGRINRGVHLAGGELVLPGSAPRGDATLVAWIWLGERCGASVREGVVCAGLAAAPLVARQDAGHAVAFGMGESRTEPRWQADDWYQVTLVRSGDAVRVFIDGEPVLAGPAADRVADGGPPRLGTGLQGKIDEVALFDRPLSGTEIAALWQASGVSEQRAADETRSRHEADERPRQASPSPAPATPPRSAEATRAGIRVPPGFRVELVAAEPDVLDPVAFDWDVQGRLWVVEMADYPSGMDGKGGIGGRVRVLTDADGDGRYETSRLFADGLSFPNGILCWRDGALVTAAPQILFLRDTDGDGRCDVRETLIDGFMEGNQQLRVNGLRWGLDGMVWCASGGHHAGHGAKTVVRSRRDGREYALGSHDFRFDPDTGTILLESGPSQYGRCRDAFGHWFGTQNANPLWHWVIADRYLARNPHVPAGTAIRHVVGPNSPPVYPASPPEKRFHSFEQAGRFTSACGSTIDGDTVLFPAAGPLHAFTCEPFHNLVQHNLLLDDGPSFAASRPDGEGPTDFFASDDRWCRPVMARTGPDGCLWVADMYRYMIEHPDWLTPDGRAELLPHYRLGDDKGRIWRIVRENAPRRGFPRAVRDADTPARRVALLDSDNAWQRDRGQQLLLRETGSAGRDEAVPLLRSLATSCPRPETRVQAICTLDALGVLDDALVVEALDDRHPRVRERALIVAEGRPTPDVVGRAVTLADDPDGKVCLQLAVSCGAWTATGAGDALVRLAARFAGDPLVRTAVMSSAVPHADRLAAGILAADPAVAAAYREPLLRQSLGRRDLATVAAILARAAAAPEADRVAAVDAVLADLQRLAADPWVIAAGAGAQAGPLVAATAAVDRELDRAAAVAVDAAEPTARRFAAARLLARAPRTRDRGVSLLSAWLVPQTDPAIQTAAVESLARSAADGVPATLAAAWPGMSPAVRAAAVEAWLSRGPWAADLLDRMASGAVPPGALSPAQRERLLRHPDRAVAARAKELLAVTAAATRRDVVDRYRGALAGAGDVGRGREVFVRSCAACHRRGEEGRNVGPNLATVVAHAPERLLANILDPSADIQPGYQSYSCVLVTGEVVNGLLVSENGGSVTMTLGDGSSRSIARGEIEELVTANRSFMPDGIEATVTIEQMRDLLAFLRGPL